MWSPSDSWRQPAGGRAAIPDCQERALGAKAFECCAPSMEGRANHLPGHYDQLQCGSCWFGPQLRLAAAGAGLPSVPVAEQLHLLVEAGLFHLGFNFRIATDHSVRVGDLRVLPLMARNTRKP